MGHKFGNLAKFRGVITYTLSPHEQKAFAGAFSKGIPNLFRRFRAKVFIVTPPFVLAYLIYSWGMSENAKSKRKDLADFAADE
ncbi:cytochrome b-c1 complex subunit 8-like [Diadema antillarum]|uniref:cytochrome b-c1 complex subunit 8-like n=1 Tax=Diadema antillarum TaxID=105358 RepID=UPI003A8AC0C8